MMRSFRRPRDRRMMVARLMVLAALSGCIAPTQQNGGSIGVEAEGQGLRVTISMSRGNVQTVVLLGPKVSDERPLETLGEWRSREPIRGTAVLTTDNPSA